MIAARNPGDDPLHRRSLCRPKTVALARRLVGPAGFRTCNQTVMSGRL